MPILRGFSYNSRYFHILTVSVPPTENAHLLNFCTTTPWTGLLDARGIRVAKGRSAQKMGYKGLIKIPPCFCLESVFLFCSLPVPCHLLSKGPIHFFIRICGTFTVTVFREGAYHA